MPLVDDLTYFAAHAPPEPLWPFRVKGLAKPEHPRNRALRTELNEAGNPGSPSWPGIHRISGHIPARLGQLATAEARADLRDVFAADLRDVAGFDHDQPRYSTAMDWFDQWAIYSVAKRQYDKDLQRMRAAQWPWVYARAVLAQKETVV